MIPLEVNKCYLLKFKRDSGRTNAKLLEIKAQILEVKDEQFGRVEIVTNHRPWGEGGTGHLYLDQIVDATEIPRGPMYK